jgi:toxin ParE1/3/4
MKFRFLAPARFEFDQAADYYEQQQSGLGREFATAVEAAIRRICDGPETFAIFENDFRYCPVARFPYIAIYRVDDMIEIVAVMHTSRRPGYWQGRTDS